MKFISWNVNGFRACLGKGFEDYFKSEEADIFCLQETKMQPGQADFDPEGYHSYENDHKNNKRKRNDISHLLDRNTLLIVILHNRSNTFRNI